MQIHPSRSATENETIIYNALEGVVLKSVHKHGKAQHGAMEKQHEKDQLVTGIP